MKILKRRAEPLRKSDKSMLQKADLKAGNDLILRTTDGKLFQQSIFYMSIEETTR
jgi:hypothetical protein